MSYSVHPDGMAGVFTATGTRRDELLETLGATEQQLSAVQAAASASTPIVSALAAFRAGHRRLITEVAARLDAALYHGREAVEAYVRGDTQMAQQYAQASVVFAGDPLPPDLHAVPGG
jgi:Family of unknown function (DUF6507)